MITVKGQCESEPPSQPCRAADRWFDDASYGLFFYYVTSLLVVFGVSTGHDFLRTARHPLAQRGDFLDAFANWDGAWYKKILEEGYRYDPEQYSSVAFFPAFPLLGRWLADLAGLRAEGALLILSHLCLAAAFVVLAGYLRHRFAADSSRRALWTLAAFGLWPTTVFCRMAYSESLFLLITVMALYGMERRWPVVVIALIIGCATATRSVGVCLLVPFAWHLTRPFLSEALGSLPSGTAAHPLPLSSRERDERFWRIARRVWLLPTACWGLFAFMLFQYLEFGEPFAFAQTQENWRTRAAVPLPTRLLGLLTLEPVRAIFDPESPCYWQGPAPEINPFFSMHLANPFYWLGALALVGIGIWKRWLTTYEWSLAFGLLLVPYVLRSHDMCMAGMGRFTAVVLPIYLVLGQLLARLPAPIAATLLALSGFFLGTYAALFAAWYRIF